jgi:hypothetical protein
VGGKWQSLLVQVATPNEAGAIVVKGSVKPKGYSNYQVEVVVQHFLAVP